MAELHDDLTTLRGLDLDLLVYLDAMLRLRSVTRAAEEVGVTQSAMSHALRRLRDRLGDALLVRAGGGMALTPAAEHLHAPLRGALVDLHRALALPPTFSPARAVRTFRLATPDLFDILLLPPLLRRLQAQAPGIDLEVGPYGREPLGQRLATGTLDLAIVPVQQGSPPPPGSSALVRQTLFRDHFRCFLRAGHPALKQEWSVDTWLSLRHLLISPEGRGDGVVDRALADEGRSRRVGLRIRAFSAAPALVARTDLVLTAPASMARVAGPLGIVDLPTPIPLPGHGIAMLWHRRFGSDPGLLWLRALLNDLTAPRRSRGVVADGDGAADVARADGVPEGLGVPRREVGVPADGEAAPDQPDPLQARDV